MGIQHKRSYTAGFIPTVAHIEKGELFVNLADNIIYSRDNSDNIVAVGATGGNNAMQLMRQSNKDKYAANGFVHYGWHDGAVGALTVNEGMSCNSTVTSWANRLGLGRISTSPNNVGESKTPFPMTNIAGFISEIRNVNLNSVNTDTFIKFPDAPDGTVIYDSTGDARGTGNPNLDLKVDTDPKYGDVAADTNEAVARAFEGTCKNGDFRNGTTDWRSASSGTISVTGGVATISGAGSAYGGARSDDIPASAGDVFHISADVTRTGGNGDMTVIAEDGTGTYLGNVGNFQITTAFTSQTIEIAGTAPTGTTRIYVLFQSGSAGNVVLEVSNVSVRATTEEVVIDRHDMFGGEFFLEAVTDANPYVYPKGMIQSQATTMNGIATSASARPATYYAVFDGDTGSAGLGLDYTSLTAAQKAEVLGDPTNNLFIDEFGNLVQWRMRQRTIAGTGNGDWQYINPTEYSGGNPALQFAFLSYVEAQGHNDTVNAFSTGWTDDTYFGTVNFQNNEKELGVWTTRPQSSTSEGVPSCFHVWGVVRRLNQGAYHPSFNPLGTARHRQDGVGYAYWYERITGFDGYRATAMCFDYANGVTGAYGGQIGSTSNGIGREDGRFYDAIYEGGDGGVNDHRLSAWDMGSKEEASKVFQKVVNGTYRGEERMRVTGKPMPVLAISDRGTYLQVAVGGDDKYKESITHWCVREDRSSAIVNTINLRTGNALIAYGDVFQGAGVESNRIYMNVDLTTDIAAGDEVFCPSIYELSDSSVSGEFPMVDVIGYPERILEIADLANGWQGGWAGIADSTSKLLTRKSLDSNVYFPYTTDAGVTWTRGNLNINTTTNHLLTAGGAGQVSVVPYTAFAKQTKQSLNKPVLNAYEGIGEVESFLGYQRNYGVLFAESLMGKVCTTSSTGHANRSHGKPTNTYFASGEIGEDSDRRPHHVPLHTIAPNNDSPAVKALWYQTSSNQQVNMGFAWNELKFTVPAIATYDGTISNTIPPYEVFLVSTGLYDNRIFQRKETSSFTGVINNLISAGDGRLYSGTGNLLTGLHSFTEYQQQHQWGDDATMRIFDNTTTYTNLNGETCLYGSAELSKPIGYTRNQARVSTQVAGIDL